MGDNKIDPPSSTFSTDVVDEKWENTEQFRSFWKELLLLVECNVCVTYRAAVPRLVRTTLQYVHTVRMNTLATL